MLEFIIHRFEPRQTHARIRRQTNVDGGRVVGIGGLVQRRAGWITSMTGARPPAFRLRYGTDMRNGRSRALAFSEPFDNCDFAGTERLRPRLDSNGRVLRPQDLGVAVIDANGRAVEGRSWDAAVADNECQRQEEQGHEPRGRCPMAGRRSHARPYIGASRVCLVWRFRSPLHSRGWFAKEMLCQANCIEASPAQRASRGRDELSQATFQGECARPSSISAEHSENLSHPLAADTWP